MVEARGNTGQDIQDPDQDRIHLKRMTMTNAGENPEQGLGQGNPGEALKIN